MDEYELRWIIKDKSGQKDENTERQTDRTRKASTSNEQRWTNMNKNEGKKTMNTTKKHPDDLQWATKIEKGGEKEG